MRAWGPRGPFGLCAAQRGPVGLFRWTHGVGERGSDLMCLWIRVRLSDKVRLKVQDQTPSRARGGPAEQKQAMDKYTSG